MDKKLFYSTVILGNLNNIRCAEEKVKLIKYVVNNKVFTGGTNFKFKTGELKIKDIIDINNVRLKAGKIILSNNKLDDLSTPDSGNSGPKDNLVYRIINNKLKDNKLKLIKVEKTKYITEEKDGKPNTKQVKAEYNEANNLIKDGKLVNLEEVIDKDTDYIFYFNYEVTFPAKTLRIIYNDVEYSNNNEIKLDCNLDENLTNIDNFYNQVKDNVVNSEGKKLDDELKTKTQPIHIIGYNMNFNIPTCGECFLGEDTFYEQLLSDYNEHITSLYLTIDKCFKYKIRVKNINGYNFKRDEKEKNILIFNKLVNKKDEQFTEDSLKALIKKELFLNDNCYNLIFGKKLEEDKKISDDNEITIEFNIENIKKDENTKKFITTYLDEKQYCYSYFFNTITGYEIDKGKIKNTGENGRIKGKLNNIEEVKAKIKEDLGLEDGEYELSNIPFLEKDFKEDAEQIIINVNVKVEDEKIKEKVFKKIEKSNNSLTSEATSKKGGNGNENGNVTGDGDKKEKGIGYSGSNNN